MNIQGRERTQPLARISHTSSVEKHFQERAAEPQVPPLRSPGFPVDARGVGDLHTALSTESRIRGRRQQCEVGNPGALRSG